MKRVRKIIISIIWVVLSLYLLLLILLQIPAIQNFAGAKVADIISNKLGTKVEINRVDLGLFNRIIIDGVNIYDKTNKLLLKAARLSTKIDLIPLAEGQISISSAQIFGAQANIYQSTAESPHNFQFIIDAFTSNDTTSNTPLNLRINSLIIRHGSICYDRNFILPTEGKFNTAHLKFSDISAHLLLKTIKKDTLNFNVKKIAFKEQSGLTVNKLSMRFEAGKSNCLLKDFLLDMPKSHIEIDSIYANYKTAGNSIISNSIEFNGLINNSYLHASDFAFLQPAFANKNNSLKISSEFNGTENALNITNLIAETDGEFISSAIGQEIMPLINIERININAKGAIDKSLSGNANCKISTDIGNLTFYAETDTALNINAKLLSDSISLSKLLNNEKFGTFIVKSDINGNIGTAEKPLLLNISTNIPHVEYNKYKYKDLALNLTYSPSLVKGQVLASDPNAKFNIEGQLVQSNSLPSILLNANIDKLVPNAIYLSDKWGNATLTGNIHTDIKGSSYANAIGIVRLDNVTFDSEEKKLELKKLVLDSRFENKEHIITLNSDFANFRVNGIFDFKSLSHSILNQLARKLPTMPGLPTKLQKTNNKIQVYGEIKNSDWIETLSGLPIQLSEPTTIVGKLNDIDGEMYANCIAPEFYYSGVKYRNGHIAITSPDDTLNYDLGAIKINNDNSTLKVNVSGKAANNKLKTSLYFDNNGAKFMEGMLNTETLFNSTDGMTTALVSIKPSFLNINNDDWDISPTDIKYSKNKLEINNFRISNQDQSLTIDGIASESTDDILKIDLRKIDVEYILDLVNFRSVNFSGEASGQAVIKAPFGEMEASSKIMVNKFTFERGRMGVLDANATWDKINKQINIKAIADDGPTAMTYISGYISPSPGYIDLDVNAQGTHLDFMQSFTKSFTSEVKGHVMGNVKILGPLKTVNLIGDLIVNGEMHITPLNCKYYLKNDTVKCVPDLIEIIPSYINDQYGNQGILSGHIRHQHLTRLTYDLFVNANNLLVYDFKDFGNEVFHGTVFGSGNVSIHGQNRELRMNVDLTTQKNSTFVYNVSTPDAIVDQKFITWNNKTHNSQTEIERGNKQTTVSGDTHINFKINATNDATIKFLMDSKTNDYISLHGSGMLNASYYNKGGFNMFGTYTVDDGTYSMTIQDIIKKDFTFKQGGTLVFGGNPEDANLNLQAVHSVNGVSLSDLNVGNSYSENTTRVNCLLNITGKPFDLQLDFGLELPTASSDQERNIRSVIQGEDGMKQQVIYLLGFGRFMPQTNNNETAQDGKKMSQTSQAMQGLLSGTLSTQINNVLKSAINSNNWNFGANISTGDEGWNNAEYEGLLNGRLLNNRLLINGQFGYRDNATTANSSFIGDFDVKYLLLPNGNLALKVYNQTNDRYFTKSSLNTQGIGIIMKKDFTNLRDLFGIKSRSKKLKKY